MLFFCSCTGLKRERYNTYGFRLFFKLHYEVKA